MEKQEVQEVKLDKNNPDSIYNWIAYKITSPFFRNIIKDFIDDNCYSFLDVDENTFQQGQLFNEFTQLIENMLNDLLIEGGITQEQFLTAAERGLNDSKYKKYFDQILNFTEYNYFKSLMTKRNYTLMKRVEEEMERKKKEEEKKKQEEIERQLLIENQKKGITKTPKELEEEKNKYLLGQMLHKEEEEELQKAIQQSLEAEEEKRRIEIIEEEELKRAIKQSLIDSVRPTEPEKKVEEKKPETKIEEKKPEPKIEEKKPEPKIEEKKPEPKKEEFKIQSNNNFNLQSDKAPDKKITTPLITNTKKAINIISNNDNFQFSGLEPPKEEKLTKPTNIISASKGFEFQIEGKKNEFGIALQKSNPYARPAPVPASQSKVQIENKHKEENLIDDDPKEKTEKTEKKDYSPTIIEIEKKNKEEIKEEKKNEIKIENKKEEKPSFNLLQFEDNSKDENIIVANEIKREKASDIIKNALNENKIQDENDDGGLLIDDEEDENPYNANNASGPKTNTFIDKKKDINLGKVKIGRDGGNFLNNFSGMQSYEKGGLQKMENRIKQQQKSVINNQNDEDDDFNKKLKEVEMEKQAKLKEYRDLLLKMKKEKRENKAKEVLSPEELAKLESKKRLAEMLKAKRK